MMGQPGVTQWPADASLRAEFNVRAAQSDSALYHDDLAQPNDAVYFHEFIAHARRHGLDYVGDSDVRLMTGGGLAPDVRKFVMRYDRIEREQYLDFMRLRRFRQSLLTRGKSATGFNLDSARIAGLRVTVASTLLQSMAEAERGGRTRESTLQGGSPADAVGRHMTAILERLDALSVGLAKLAAPAERRPLLQAHTPAVPPREAIFAKLRERGVPSSTIRQVTAVLDELEGCK